MKRHITAAGLALFCGAGGVVAADTGILARGPLPTAEEANAAFSRDPDYAASVGVVRKILACVPAAWEDSVDLPEEKDWWCLAEAQIAGKDPALAEFGLYLDPKSRQMETLVGEFMGMCPPSNAIKGALVKMVTLKGVTDLYSDTLAPGHYAVDMGFDAQLPKDVLQGPPYLFYCDYVGRRNGANYLLKTFVTFDADGYHLTDRSFEQLFNDDGVLVDENGKVLDDQ